MDLFESNLLAAKGNVRMFQEKLSILNENFLRFLRNAYNSDSAVDFTPTINDYFKHLRELDRIYYAEENSVQSTPIHPPIANLVSTAAPTTTLGSSLVINVSAVQNSTSIAIPHDKANSSELSNVVEQRRSESRKRTATQSIDEIAPYGRSRPKENVGFIPSSTTTEIITSANAMMTTTSPLFSVGNTTTSLSAGASLFSGLLTQTTTTTLSDPTTLPTLSTASTSLFSSGFPFPNGLTFSNGIKPQQAQTTVVTSSKGLLTTAIFPFTTTASPATTTATTTVKATTAPSFFSFGPASSPFSTITAIPSGGTTPSHQATTGALAATASGTLATSSNGGFSFTSSKTASPSTTTTAVNLTTPFGASLFPAVSSSTSLFGGLVSQTGTSAFGVAPKTLSNDAAGEGGGGSDDEQPAEEFVPTDNFKPLVPLPPKVDVKSGEENEEVLFDTRCKLYRYDKETKQNKERGVGELKILHNKAFGRYRCVIRSDDQLSKLFANFPLFDSIKSQQTHENKPNVRTVQCKDFSENSSGIDEIFLIKFRNEAAANDFTVKLQETAGKLLSECDKTVEKE